MEAPQQSTGTVLRSTTHTYGHAPTADNQPDAEPSYSPYAHWNESSPSYRAARTQSEIREGSFQGPVRALTQYTYDTPLASGNVREERKWDSTKSAQAPSTLTTGSGAIMERLYDVFGNISHPNS